MISKILNTPFNFSHAAAISIVAHFVFLSVYSFEVFNQPTFAEKKYKKFRLEIVKRPQVILAKRKPLKAREPILRKFNKPVLQKPALVSVSSPTRKFESKPIQFIKATPAKLENRVVKNIQIRTSVSIQETKFNNPVESEMPRVAKKISENFSEIVFPLPSKVETGKILARGASLKVFEKVNKSSSKMSDSDNPPPARLAVSVHTRFDRNKKQPLKQADKLNRIGSVRPSTLVATLSTAKYSFKPQVINMTVLAPEQDRLSEEELNNLWAGYTTKVRQMIAKAKIYPPKAREKGQQGKIQLSFKIGKDGRVLKLLVEHSSGYEILDEAARMAITDAGPFPPIPEKLNKQYALLELPISFVLR
tara:strand:- start:73 stop:1158 length:1086 start_codon:yes stop_codon:yes gene_type:complete